MQSNCSTNIYPLFALLSHELMGAYNVVGFKARGGSLKGVNLSCFEVSQDNGSFISTFKYDDAYLSGSQE